MTYLSLCNDDGIQVTAAVDDALWASMRASIERAATAAGYSVRCDNTAEGLYPSKTCHSMSEIAAWIADTAQWV
jgi:hypothetical protein